MSQTLHGFALGLLTDPAAMADYRLDPEAALAEAGLEDITPQDVQEIMPLVLDYANGYDAEGALAVGEGTGAGMAGTSTPLGDFVANGTLHATDGPQGTTGFDSPLGGLTGELSPAGMDLAGGSDFTAVGDLGDTLDSGALAGAAAEAVADGGGYLGSSLTAGAEVAGGMLTSGAAAVGSGLTGGANSASSLLTSGATSTASLLTAGSDLAAHALTDPAETASVVIENLSAGQSPVVDDPRLPFDQIPTELPVQTPDAHVEVPPLPAELQQPVDGSELPVELPQLPVDLPQLPVDLPQLPVEVPQLPVDTGDPLGTIGDLQDVVTSTVYDTPAGDVLDQSGLGDTVSDSPVSDVLGGSRPDDTTDLVPQLGGLDDLPL